MAVDWTTVAISAVSGGGMLFGAIKLYFAYLEKKLAKSEISEGEINEIKERYRQEYSAKCSECEEWRLKLEDLLREKSTAVQLQSASINKARSAVYYALHNLRVQFGFDRVFILQPHPKYSHKYISVVYEVTENRTSVTDTLHKIDVSLYKRAYERLKSTEFIEIGDIDKMENENIKALFKRIGSHSVFAQRIEDVMGAWEGSIIAEYHEVEDYDTKVIRDAMEEEAIRLKNIIPEIKED